MADVVAVNHYWRDRHSCLLANFHRVEGIDECRDAAFLKCPYGMNDDLSPTNNWPLFHYQVKPRWRTVSAAVRVVSHVGCAAKSRKPPAGDGRRVSIGIHLQRRSGERINRVLAGKFT